MIDQLLQIHSSEMREETQNRHELLAVKQQPNERAGREETYMWVPVGAWGNVDDWVAAEEHLLGWPDHVGEGQRGVGEHAVAERRCCLHIHIQIASSVRLSVLNRD